MKNVRYTYKGNDIMHLFGDDFQFIYAKSHFESIDRLIKNIN